MSRHMNLQPGNFRLASSPLALVLAQFSLGAELALEDETCRACLRTCGLDKLSHRLERNLTVSPTNPKPIVEDRKVYILLDREGHKGLSLVKNALAYFTSAHAGFDSLLDELKKVFECLGTNGALRFTSMALRYVNAFEIGSDLTDIVKDSLGGLDRTGLDLPHYHHNYEFWCETSDGRLHARLATDHGDRKPKNLGHAEVVYPNRCLWSCEQMIGHLDIFETSKDHSSRPLEWSEAIEMLKRMNLNIEQAFLNAIQQDALVTRFGAELKQ